MGTEQVIAWGLAMFFLGVALGGFVWVPYVVKRERKEFLRQVQVARRIREMAEQRDDTPRSTGGGL